MITEKYQVLRIILITTTFVILFIGSLIKSNEIIDVCYIVLLLYFAVKYFVMSKK